MLLLLLLPIILLLFIVVHKQNEQQNLMKMGIFLQLYEKIHKDESFKRIEKILENTESPDFEQLVKNEKEGFEEYLRFFDSVVLMRIPNYFSKHEADLLFARPTELLTRHHFVRNYIAAQNYKNLDAVLVSNEGSKTLSS